MSARHPHYGLGLAAFGALAITPDTLFMRLSGMSGTQMVAWRGLATGLIFLMLWLVTRRAYLRADLAILASPIGLTVVGLHACNAAAFSLGIANAPVSIVLFAVASMPVFAALFAHLFAGEPARRSTWVTMAAVMAGIGVAVFGRDSSGVGLNTASFIGAAAGLAVAALLAATFVIFRHRPEVPILPVMGFGGLLTGSIAAFVVGPAAMLQGHVWATLVSAALILPMSFVALSSATRHTAAVNVSLLMLLETVLGPAWVWAGIGEAMHLPELLGGAIVVGSLTLYILSIGRSQAAA